MTKSINYITVSDSIVSQFGKFGFRNKGKASNNLLLSGYRTELIIQTTGTK